MLLAFPLLFLALHLFIDCGTEARIPNEMIHRKGGGGSIYTGKTGGSIYTTKRGGTKRKRIYYDDIEDDDDDDDEDYGNDDDDYIDDDSENEDELIAPKRNRKRKMKRRPATPVKKKAKHTHKHNHNHNHEHNHNHYHYNANGNNHQANGNVATTGKKDHTKLLLSVGGGIATAIGAFALGNTSGQLQSNQQQNMYGMYGNGFMGQHPAQFFPRICPLGMLVC